MTAANIFLLGMVIIFTFLSAGDKFLCSEVIGKFIFLIIYKNEHQKLTIAMKLFD